MALAQEEESQVEEVVDEEEAPDLLLFLQSTEQTFLLRQALSQMERRSLLRKNHQGSLKMFARIVLMPRTLKIGLKKYPPPHSALFL